MSYFNAVRIGKIFYYFWSVWFEAVDKQIIAFCCKSQGYAYGDYRRAKPNNSAGMMIYTRKYYIGTTTSQILQVELSKEKGIPNQDRAFMHYYATGGYKVVVSPEFSVLPSVMIKYVQPAPLSVAVNIKVFYQDKVWIGGSYRHKDAAVVLAGVNISNLLQVGYAYDISNSDIGRVSDGSQEIVVGLLLKNRGKVFCPASLSLQL